ncbi:MAG: hypothetical protein DMF75_19615 [Acidobacteria bacterium]|nr:MAG: hypothetical protein DMF75_19615 [Acidobacteriota bacterium]
MGNLPPDPTPNASAHETAALDLSHDLTTTPPGKKRRIAWVVLGTVILGAVGSGLWDLLMKPGVSRFGRLFLGIITFGSKTLRDSAYSSAALDPTSLPALVILWLVAGSAMFIILINSVSRTTKAFSRNPKSISKPPTKKRRKAVFIIVAIILDRCWPRTCSFPCRF